LHFQNQNAYVRCEEAKRLCKEHIPEYEKAIPCEKLFPNQEDAVRRAAALDQSHERNGQSGANPSTAVYRLTERIGTSRARGSR
jgi:hypothetical protein